MESSHHGQEHAGVKSGSSSGSQNHGHAKGHHDSSKDGQKGKGSSERERARRAELIARAKERREALLKQIRHEKLTMLCSSLIAILSSFIWIIAVSIDYWYLVYGDEEMLNSKNYTSVKIFVSSNTGLFRSCRVIRSNTTEEAWCKYHTLFPNIDDIAKTPGLDEHVIDYTRTEICFAIISLLLMVMTIFSAFYTFKNSRYMYKRLAAGLYFLTSVCVLVVLEVLVTSVRYEQLNVPFNHPVNSTMSYGISFYLGWSVFLVYLVNGCIFLVLSRKRKGDKGLGEDADESQIMGR